MMSTDDRLDTFIENIQLVNSNDEQQQPTQRYTGAIPKSLSASSSSSSALMKQKAEHLPKNFISVVNLINDGRRVCVILRGLPGSGKSYLAYQIIEETVKNPAEHIFSADKFFINSRGQYKFEPEKIPTAHEFTQRQFTQGASQGMSPLIVDNTNMCYWEMYYYIQVAVQYGYHVEIMEPETPWKFAEGKLASKNQHSVPSETIKRMKAKYETGVSIAQILASLNLDVVREPKMRNIPPILKDPVVKDLIDFEVEPAIQMPSTAQWKQQEPLTRKESPVSEPSAFQWSEPSQVFEDVWDGPAEKEAEVEETEKLAQDEPQPQRKQRKSKPNRSPQSKLTPHCKNCPNENLSFSNIRDFYPGVNDKYLWDFFERCNGDADWCVNLLMDENLTDQMEAGNDLTCTCFGNDVTKPTVAKTKKDEPAKQAQQSPVAKGRKAKTDAIKQINLGEWLETKEAIEKSVTIAQEHYPDHVNMVKSWKKTQTEVAPVEEEQQPEVPFAPISPGIEDELQELPIATNLILALDELYGGGLLKNIIDDQRKFPSKIFIKSSIAHQLYLEIMEVYYSQAEEARLQAMKEDEELAKKLSEEEASVSKMKKVPKKNGVKEIVFEQKVPDSDYQNEWNNEETNDDIALKMSKEKLAEMFPELNKDDLMEIFAGNSFNFDDTVATIQDSLFCTPEERAKIAKTKDIIFNTRWQDTKEKCDDVDDVEKENGYTSEHLKTVENLRQEIKDYYEEQKVCREKAGKAIQQKQFELASYYSNIALLHSQKAAEAKHEVANMIASIHEKTQPSSTTLELHFMSQIEATMLIDNFLDRRISRLRATKKPHEDLTIITGRGKHSANGIAAIKNKTKSRLKERNLG